MSYEFVHSVECEVRPEFARRLWSDVGNWAAVDSSVGAATQKTVDGGAPQGDAANPPHV